MEMIEGNASPEARPPPLRTCSTDEMKSVDSDEPPSPEPSTQAKRLRSLRDALQIRLKEHRGEEAFWFHCRLDDLARNQQEEDDMIAEILVGCTEVQGIKSEREITTAVVVLQAKLKQFERRVDARAMAGKTAMWKRVREYLEGLLAKAATDARKSWR